MRYASARPSWIITSTVIGYTLATPRRRRSRRAAATPAARLPSRSSGEPSSPRPFRGGSVLIPPAAGPERRDRSGGGQACQRRQGCASPVTPRGGLTRAWPEVVPASSARRNRGPPPRRRPSASPRRGPGRSRRSRRAQVAATEPSVRGEPLLRLLAPRRAPPETPLRLVRRAPGSRARAGPRGAARAAGCGRPSCEAESRGRRGSGRAPRRQRAPRSAPCRRNAITSSNHVGVRRRLLHRPRVPRMCIRQQEAPARATAPGIPGSKLQARSRRSPARRPRPSPPRPPSPCGCRRRSAPRSSRAAPGSPEHPSELLLGADLRRAGAGGLAAPRPARPAPAAASASPRAIGRPGRRTGRRRRRSPG